MLKRLIIGVIVFYRKYISPLKKPSCVFYPTCSLYAIQAIEKYGVLKGVSVSIKRIVKCHPWQTPRVDLLK